MTTHKGLFQPASEIPTVKERLDFLELMLRRSKVHQASCESKRPHLVERFLIGPKMTFPFACDCYLSHPLGSVGLAEGWDKHAQ